MSKGWIKLHRKLLKSRAYANPELLKLWVLCLCKANHEKTWVEIPGVTDPIEVNPGEFVTGRYSLHRDYYTQKSGDMKSEITLWRWLKKLEKWGNLNIKSHTKYTVVRITEWEKYQKIDKDDQQNEQQVNSNCTTDEQQVNTDKNDKNVKNDKKGDATAPDSDGVEVPTIEEFKKYGNQIGIVPDYCEHVYESSLSRGWRNGHDNLIRDWRAYLRMKFKYQHKWIDEQRQEDDSGLFDNHPLRRMPISEEAGLN